MSSNKSFSGRAERAVCTYQSARSSAGPDSPNNMQQPAADGTELETVGHPVVFYYPQSGDKTMLTPPEKHLSNCDHFEFDILGVR